MKQTLQVVLILTMSAPATAQLRQSLPGVWSGEVSWKAPDGLHSANIRLVFKNGGVAELTPAGGKAVALTWSIEGHRVHLWRRADRADELVLSDLRVLSDRFTANMRPAKLLHPLPDGYEMRLALKRVKDG